MIEIKFFVRYTLKKKWFWNRKKETIIVGFEDNPFKITMSWEYEPIMKHEIQKRTGKKVQHINSVECIGRFNNELRSSEPVKIDKSKYKLTNFL